MLWTRDDDTKGDAFRAPASHRVAAGLDAQGQLVAWSHKVVSPSILKDINPNAIKNGVDFYCLGGLADYAESPMWNNKIQYEIPNLDIEFFMSTLPVPVCPWRSGTEWSKRLCH